MQNTPVSSDRRQAHMLSEINVTPFVDVMLVLLIIFMVTAPMLQQGIRVSLPQTKSSGVQVSKNPMILKITKDRNIYIGESTIALKNLPEKLKALFEHRPEEAVYLQADKSVPYGIVAQTLAEIKSSGINNVNLITIVK